MKPFHAAIRNPPPASASVQAVAEAEIGAHMSYLATQRHVSAADPESGGREFRRHLCPELEWLGDLSTRSAGHVPVRLTRDECALGSRRTRRVRAAGITKTGESWTLRHSLATRLMEISHDLRTIYELLGHRDVSTTMTTDANDV